MATKPKFNSKKAVFQVRYTPDLEFYNQMYSHTKLFSKYPHWETDRLRLTLKDFEKRQSLTIKYDSIGYETDEYKESLIKENVDSIEEYVNGKEAGKTITRIGFRKWSLCPVSMEFEDLRKIMNLKLLQKDFINLTGDEYSDMTATVTGNYKGLVYRLQVGPIRDIEIPNFIHYNIDAHIDSNSIKKYTDIASIYSSYPKVSIYIDVDIYLSENAIKTGSVKNFFEESTKLHDIINKNLLNHIFDSKI
ncbi:MAG: hypothetical protein OQJ96_01425 [Flavobacteriales bacterium]|nr:hypothetical protein [Flavobacteriales bacterium]MCW8912583.1 hypothetical protein [Flavobacteriales bacterium]MCW8938188.1 hypothetical protein [Flavobacteriales bacterium]MCW8941020.1 hypothetical protein [Flavobacteriales bacterium]MCW8967020.1 hypothetical protein [Flavobacteriales bacterium]